MKQSSAGRGSAQRLRVALVGLGRMGMIHAQHAFELSRETGLCDLVAVSTSIPDQAKNFLERTNADISVFDTIGQLAAADVCDAVVIATNTYLHREHATLMLEKGKRVLLEKPLTGTLEGDREFAAFLHRRFPHDVMLGFQRRFDAPLQFAKELLDAGRIGRLFRMYSALEDSGPAPDRFNSPGLLPDMGIHNVDEILWCTGRLPERAVVLGSNLHSHRLSTCVEDFDDALLLMDFGGEAGNEMLAQVQVSRNHTSGYRVETSFYGERGQIHVGRFHGDPHEIIVEAYGTRGEGQIVSRRFTSRIYDEPLPEFADRYGAAYKEELRVFATCCADGKPFPVTHRDALLAQEVIDSAMSRALTRDDMAAVRYD